MTRIGKELSLNQKIEELLALLPQLQNREIPEDELDGIFYFTWEEPFDGNNIEVVADYWNAENNPFGVSDDKFVVEFNGFTRTFETHKEAVEFIEERKGTFVSKRSRVPFSAIPEEVKDLLDFDGEGEKGYWVIGYASPSTEEEVTEDAKPSVTDADVEAYRKELEEEFGIKIKIKRGDGSAYINAGFVDYAILFPSPKEIVERLGWLEKKLKELEAVINGEAPIFSANGEEFTVDDLLDKEVPANIMGWLIGKGGSHIKALSDIVGERINLKKGKPASVEKLVDLDELAEYVKMI